jgi:hypothetical protein
MTGCDCIFKRQYKAKYHVHLFPTIIQSKIGYKNKLIVSKNEILKSNINHDEKVLEK